MQNDVNALDGIDLNGDMNLERHSDNEDEDNEPEEDQKEEDEHEKEDEHEHEHEDEDDGKEHRTICQGEMVYTLADDVDTMIDCQPILLPEQGQTMREHTPCPQPPAPAPWQQSPEPCQGLRTSETYLLSRLEHFGLLTLPKPRLVGPNRGEADAARSTSDVDVEQQLLGKSAGGNSLPDLLLFEEHTDGLVSEKWTSPDVAVEAMNVAFRLVSGSGLDCLLWTDQCISDIDYYTCHEEFVSLRVDFINQVWFDFISFVLLWDIMHAAFLQLLACKKPVCDGVEAQRISQVSWQYRELTHQPTRA